MSKQIPILEYVKEVIQANRFAVLATECDGQPYASLLAVTATNDYLKLRWRANCDNSRVTGIPSLDATLV